MRIKDILKEKGITAKELAVKIGMSEAGISVALSDKGNPSLSTLEKIATALEVETPDLFRTTSHRDTITCPNCGAEFVMKKK